MLGEAIAHFHELLERGDTAERTAEALTEFTHKRRLTFGDRAVCTVLRPFFIDTDTYTHVRRQTEVLLRAIGKLYRVLMRDPGLRARMDLTPDEEAIVHIEPGYAAPDASGRMDAFLGSEGEFRFVEYNAESPGGLMYGDVLSDVFIELPVMGEFVRRFPVRAVPVRSNVLETLLDCYRQWGGSAKPSIAIVDWRTVKTKNEFLLFQEYLSPRGFSSVIADPDELEYRDGRLRAGEFAIDLVYKRVVTGELLAKYGLDHPLIHATRDRAVCTVNSFRVQMLYKKMLFALLSDPEHTGFFDGEELNAINRHIPWTRKLRHGRTVYGGGAVDLLDFVTNGKDRLVLKPNGEYGGRGVVLGWTCDQSTWENAIADGLRSSYVVQERVPVGNQSFPSYIDGQLRYDERFFDLDPYVWQGARVDGCGIRLSASALLNVSAGGGSAVPMFVLGKG